MASNTISIQGRIDVKSFATLARAYMKEGVPIRSKSDVLWHAVEQLANFYENKLEELTPFETIFEAIHFLEHSNLGLQTTERRRAEVSRLMIRESYYNQTGEDLMAKPATITKGIRKKVIPERDRMTEDQMAEEARRFAASEEFKRTISDASRPRTPEEQAEIDKKKNADIKDAILRGIEKEKNDEAL